MKTKILRNVFHQFMQIFFRTSIFVGENRTFQSINLKPILFFTQNITKVWNLYLDKYFLFSNTFLTWLMSNISLLLNWKQEYEFQKCFSIIRFSESTLWVRICFFRVDYFFDLICSNEHLNNITCFPFYDFIFKLKLNLSSSWYCKNNLFACHG